MLKDFRIDGRQKIHVDFDGVDYHWSLSEERSGSITEAESSSEGESSKPTKTKLSFSRASNPYTKEMKAALTISGSQKLVKSTYQVK